MCGVLIVLALKPQVRLGFLELAGPVDMVLVGVGAPSLGVTFDILPRPLHWRPSSPVNEVEDPGSTVWLMSVCERLLIV